MFVVTGNSGLVFVLRHLRPPSEPHPPYTTHYTPPSPSSPSTATSTSYIYTYIYIFIYISISVPVSLSTSIFIKFDSIYIYTCICIYIFQTPHPTMSVGVIFPRPRDSERVDSSCWNRSTASVSRISVVLRHVPLGSRCWRYFRAPGLRHLVLHLHLHLRPRKYRHNTDIAIVIDSDIYI